MTEALDLLLLDSAVVAMLGPEVAADPAAADAGRCWQEGDSEVPA